MDTIRSQETGLNQGILSLHTDGIGNVEQIFDHLSRVFVEMLRGVEVIHHLLQTNFASGRKIRHRIYRPLHQSHHLHHRKVT